MNKTLVIFSLLFFAWPAAAFNFTLNQSEFNSWDFRCKQAFLASQAGRSSGFYPNASAQQISEARRFGEQAGGAWHYCAGVILIQRAMASTGNEREQHLNRAVSEIRFTVNRIKAEHHWYPEIHVDYARALYLNNNLEEAFAVLNRLVSSHPMHSLPYTALAYYLKQQNQLSQAITILKQAPEALQQQSAELNYFISWYLLDAGKTQEAIPFAQKAYELNYPVPSLRQRLAALGHRW